MLVITFVISSLLACKVSLSTYRSMILSQYCALNNGSRGVCLSLYVCRSAKELIVKKKTNNNKNNVHFLKVYCTNRTIPNILAD